MQDVVLKTQNLTKLYKHFTALDHVNMAVHHGDIYGLIGRNGAGKTTLMKIVTGLSEKNSGSFELFGKNGAAASKEKTRIGCLIENPAFFAGMTAWQNLNYYCIQKGVTDKKQIDEALSLVDLANVRDKKFRKFSLGMKQRLGIAFALLDNPDLVILDEPINGLDPIGISELRDTFRRLNQEKDITFIISSHILSELYHVANTFLFIDHGKVLKEITKEELDRECMRCIVIKTPQSKQAVALMEKEMHISNYKVINNDEVRVYDEYINAEALNKLLILNNVPISSVYETGISLEDYFKSLVGEVQK